MSQEEQIQLIPLHFIMPLPFNVSGRMQSELDDMLRRDMTRIESEGINKIDPIIVRKLSEEEKQKYREKYPWAEYMIVDGYKRWEAARDLGWKNIRAIVKNITLEEAEELNYKKNKIRGTVDPMREAAYFKKLHEVQKLSIDEIAEKFGLTHRRVEQILSRIKIAEPVKKILKGGETGFTPLAQYYEIVGSVTEPEKQQQLAEIIVKEKLSRRQAEIAKEALQKGLPPEKTVEIIKKAEREKLAPKETKKIVEAVTLKPELAEEIPQLPKEEIKQKIEETLKPPEIEETETIPCPYCGKPLKINWKQKKLEMIKNEG